MICYEQILIQIQVINTQMCTPRTASYGKQNFPFHLYVSVSERRDMKFVGVSNHSDLKLIGVKKQSDIKLVGQNKIAHSLKST